MKRKPTLLEDFPYYPCSHVNPDTGNLSCIAMCLNWHGITGYNPGELEDALSAKLWDRCLCESEHRSIQWLINGYRNQGVICTFRTDGDLEHIRTAIDSNNPVILGGLWTRTGSTAVCFGYDENGLYIHRPFAGIRGNSSYFTNNAIKEICSPESRNNASNIWMHTVARIKVYTRMEAS
jgi:hypothetical protein